MATKSTVSVSVPSEVRVRGYVVKRMPLGRYLTAMQLLGTLPGELMEVCFPGQSIQDVIAALRGADGGTLAAWLTKLLAVAPERLIGLLSALLDITEQELLDDAALGLDGLIDLVNAWIEVNNLAGFLKAVQALGTQVRQMSRKTETGSND